MRADYGSLSARHEHVFEASGRMFAPECRAAEESISLSFSSYFSLAESSAGFLDGRSGRLAAFFYRNCVYLSAAYRMARMGMLDPAGNNLRTVFETIIWQYAYLLDDGMYGNFLEISSLEEEKMRSVREGKWSNTKERALENLRRKYSFQKMMKKLYSKEAFEKFFISQYWAMCQKSHSSLIGVNLNTPNMHGTTTIQKGPDEIREMLRAILYLLAENLVCFMNVFGASLREDGVKRLLAAVNGINMLIPPALGLAPDTREMEFRTRLREVRP
ncbi:MAG: hypothetical protein AB1324_08455 [Candidatus Micrarchaeota archaeon]